MSSIPAKLDSLKQAPLSKQEKAVMAVLYDAYTSKAGRVTQAEIARHDRWLGCHPREEGHVRNRLESTLRQVRQIVRDLRVNHKAPILSDSDGYWIPQDESEAKAFLERFEGEAKAQNKSRFETYRTMRDVFGFTSEYFEGQEKLL